MEDNSTVSELIGLSQRLDFLENENNQSISDAPNQMSSRIEEINTPQLISSLEIIDSNLSDIYQRIDKIEDNPPTPDFSPESLGPDCSTGKSTFPRSRSRGSDGL